MTGQPRVYTSLEEVHLPPGRPIVLTIGTFDGVHLAHQALFAEAAAQAAELGGDAAALTFRNHPRAIVSPENAPPLLTPWPRKRALLLAQPLQHIVALEFNPTFAQTAAEEFVQRVIAGIFRARVVISGPAFHFGHGGRGNAELLSAMSATHGFLYRRREPVMHGGEKVSSTRIRRCLSEGRVSEAAELLTRPHRNSGTVVRGDGIGNTIGFPTANLEMEKEEFVPADGVYAVEVLLPDSRRQPGMMNIGTRPTVGGIQHRKEVHLIGFEGELNGARLEVLYRQRLRDEKRFSGLEELKAQLARDREAALSALGEEG